MSLRVSYRKLTVVTILWIVLLLAAYVYRKITVEEEWQRRHPWMRNSRMHMGNATLEHGLTLVTAYLNVGNFTKGTEGQRDASLYRQWLQAFRLIDNPVVAYFDEWETAAYFRQLRSGKPSKIFVVDTTELWSFTLRDRIQEVHASPLYKKAYPNTVNAGYVCAMHAKHELVERAIRSNFYRTKYVGWIDVGIYRDMSPQSEPSFYLEMPANHDEEAVIFSQVEPLNPRLPIVQAIRDTYFFVAGGFFAGRLDVMLRFVNDYRHAVTDLLELNLTNADQSILYAMYHPLSERRPAVSIQAFKATSGYSVWFFLCHMLRDQWLSHSYTLADIVMYD